MIGHALFRYPHASTCHYISGTTAELDSVASLDGHEGFVVAPFEVAPQRPVNVISPETCLSDIPVGRVAQCLPHLDATLIANSKGAPHEGIGGVEVDYVADFNRFHERLAAGDFQKLVLARASDELLEGSRYMVSPVSLFLQACRNYPRLFIALVHTPKSGLWLVATPEVLLERTRRCWLTTALAGTMRLSPEQQAQDMPDHVEWTSTCRQEQQYVADYIRSCLDRFAYGVDEEGPYTVRAADLVHLRTDFRFALRASDRIGQLLQALHPTPAVCGLPKESAFRFILQNEYTPRGYYSGFMGPLRLKRKSFLLCTRETHLYVSLRCMSIHPPGYFQLFAGGGLLPESTCGQEWQETEAKLNTMRRLLWH